MLCLGILYITVYSTQRTAAKLNDSCALRRSPAVTAAKYTIISTASSRHMKVDARSF